MIHLLILLAAVAAPNFTAMTTSQLWHAQDRLCGPGGVAEELRSVPPGISDRGWGYQGRHSPAEEAAHFATLAADHHNRQLLAFQRHKGEMQGLYAELSKRAGAAPLSDGAKRVLLQGAPADAADVDEACAVLKDLAER